MASEDYKVGNVNISVLAKNNKQTYGMYNLLNAKKLLSEYSIIITEITQGLKFTINNENYTYWSKKNRVYKGTIDTGLTLNKFIKDNNEIFIKDNSDEIKFHFGRYINKSIEYVFKKDINYINWIIDNYKPITEKDKKLYTQIEIMQKNAIKNLIYK